MPILRKNKLFKLYSRMQDFFLRVQNGANGRQTVAGLRSIVNAEPKLLNKAVCRRELNLGNKDKIAKKWHRQAPNSRNCQVVTQIRNHKMTKKEKYEISSQKFLKFHGLFQPFFRFTFEVISLRNFRIRNSVHPRDRFSNCPSATFAKNSCKLKKWKDLQLNKIHSEWLVTNHDNETLTIEQVTLILNSVAK